MFLFSSVLKSHYKSILVFFVAINIVILATSTVVYNSQLSYMEKAVINNIEEYDEVDREHLCKLLECASVIDIIDNKHFIMNETRSRLLKTKFIEPNLIHLWRNIVLVDGEVSLYVDEAKSYFILNSSELMYEIIVIFTFVIPISLIIFR
jgi:hypothetical protein